MWTSRFKSRWKQQSPAVQGKYAPGLAEPLSEGGIRQSSEDIRFFSIEAFFS